MITLTRCIDIRAEQSEKRSLKTQTKVLGEEGQPPRCAVVTHGPRPFVPLDQGPQSSQGD